MTTANRILWTVVGVVLLGLGVVGFLVSIGRFPGTYSDSPLLWPALLDRWRDWDGWATAGVVVVGLLIALAGVLLLRTQLTPRAGPAMPDLVLDADRAGADPGAAEAGGSTHVRTAVLASGLSRDLQRYQGIRHANADIAGDRIEPALTLRITVDPGADLAAVRRHVDASVRRFAVTTDLKPARVDVLTKVTDRAADRVS